MKRTMVFIKSLFLVLFLFLNGCGMSNGNSTNASNGMTGADARDQVAAATTSKTERTVTLHDPYLQNMAVLTLTCKPGWQLLGTVNWEEAKMGSAPIPQIKGSNSALKGGFYFEGGRNYYDENDGVETGGRHKLFHSVKHPFTNMEDYALFVTKQQFPHAKNYNVTERILFDGLPEAQRNLVQKIGKDKLQRFQQDMAQSAMGSSFAVVKNAAVDGGMYEIAVTLDDRKVYHFVEVYAYIIDVNYPVGSFRRVDHRMWEQLSLYTYTAPDPKTLERVYKEARGMINTAKMNDDYTQTVIAMQQNQVQQIQAMVRKGMADNARQAQQLSLKVQQNAREISDIQRSMYENISATNDRVAALQSEAIRGVNPYTSSDGTVIDVPISSGSQVWSTSDAGSVITTDSYFFNPNINSNIEYQQMQLLH